MTTLNTFEIAGRKIGLDHPPYVIAELGINHGGSVEVAHRMIDTAKETGVDALKLQTFITDRFLSRKSPYFELLRGSELPSGSIPELLTHSREAGLTMFSTVFDETSADLWETLGAVAYKIASCDITHIPLLRHVSRLGKPIILSTGGATVEEVMDALTAIRLARDSTPVAVLHCVSKYPTTALEVNLACMSTMREQFRVPIGFSDHTLGNVVPIAAAALGAELLEKHYTLDRTAEGPDHALSADPEQMREMVLGVHRAWQAIGLKQKKPIESNETITALRRSVTITRELSAGTVITREMLAIKRPGHGIQPTLIEKVIGKTLRQNLKCDDTLTWDDLA